MSTLTKYAEAHGLTRVDSRKPLKITVLPKDLKKSIKKDPQNCGFAQACKRENPKAEAVFFFKSSAWVHEGKILKRYVMPGSMQKEIVAFDRGAKFDPGEYQLSAPSPSNTLEANRKRNLAKADNPRPKTASSKPPRVAHKTGGVRGPTVTFK